MCIIYIYIYKVSDKKYTVRTELFSSLVIIVSFSCHSFGAAAMYNLFSHVDQVKESPK